MKSKLHTILAFTAIIFLTNCTPEVYLPPEPNELFNKYKSCVVLVYNQYYYRVEFGTDTVFYSPSSEKKIFFDENEVMSFLSSSSGTGFFISQKGQIVTNRHVVSPEVSDVKSELIRLRGTIIEFLEEKNTAYKDTMEFLKDYYSEEYDSFTIEYREELKSEYQRLNKQSERLSAEIENFSGMKVDGGTPEIVIVSLGIAYDDTYVTELDDLHECVVIKKSEEIDMDLAIIQTKDKTIRKNPDYIFNFDDNNPNIESNPKQYKPRDIRTPVNVNDEVFMIGYNRGFTLANTKDGIQCQFTKGEISQASDGRRILYSIPTLEGSSGSPVIDKWGNLVGVNFSKLKDSQNFNFAIPVNELKKFYESL